MKLSVEFVDGLIKVSSGCDIQYATEVAFGYNGDIPVMHISKELGVREEQQQVPQSGYRYLDGKG